MTWRNHNSHREETAAVKKALEEAGYKGVRVGHGHGTGWSWLKIYWKLQPGQDYMETWQHIVAIAQRVTGRHGEYHGEINVHLT
jgi:hypothetical protein